MEVREVVSNIEGRDRSFEERARRRTGQLVMPSRALGDLHLIGERLCGILRTMNPRVQEKAVLVMAGDHGIAGSGVSAYPQAVTGEMVRTFLNGGAAINVLAHLINARVVVLDVGILPEVTPREGRENRLIVSKVDRGTRDISKGPAMNRRQAEDSVIKGYEAASALFQEGTEMLGTGDMGIGNTSPSAAVGSVMTGTPVEEMAGRGTGLDDEGFRKKCGTISAALSINRPRPEDPLDVLAKVGGFEIGAIAGAILAAGRFHRPVVIDGFISGAGALIARALCPHITDYVFAAHRSAEQGHLSMLKHLDLSPLLDLGMRLGEGTGAALAMQLVEAGARVMCEVATFEEAGVSKA